MNKEDVKKEKEKYLRKRKMAKIVTIVVSLIMAACYLAGFN